MIVEDLNQNVMDQRMVEFEFTKISSAKVRRLTLTQCYDQVKIDQNRSNRLMLVDGQLEIAVIYFRYVKI